MTNEDLAHHWKVSLNKVKNISDTINRLYSVALDSDPDSNVWNVVLRANDGKNDYTLMEEGTNFTDKNKAIIQGTHWAQQIKMTPGQAELMDLPEDAFLALQPIAGYEQAIKQKLESSRKNIRQNYQHD